MGNGQAVLMCWDGLWLSGGHVSDAGRLLWWNEMGHGGGGGGMSVCEARRSNTSM